LNFRIIMIHNFFLVFICMKKLLVECLWNWHLMQWFSTSMSLWYCRLFGLKKFVDTPKAKLRTKWSKFACFWGYLKTLQHTRNNSTAHFCTPVEKRWSIANFTYIFKAGFALIFLSRLWKLVEIIKSSLKK